MFTSSMRTSSIRDPRIPWMFMSQLQRQSTVLIFTRYVCPLPQPVPTACLAFACNVCIALSVLPQQCKPSCYSSPDMFGWSDGDLSDYWQKGVHLIVFVERQTYEPVGIRENVLAVFWLANFIERIFLIGQKSLVDNVCTLVHYSYIAGRVDVMIVIIMMTAQEDKTTRQHGNFRF